MKKIYLKWKYKRLYLKILNYGGYDCGNSLQMHLDSRFYNLLEKFNKTADALSEIDPECPTFRYDVRGNEI